MANAVHKVGKAGIRAQDKSMYSKLCTHIYWSGVDESVSTENKGLEEDHEKIFDGEVWYVLRTLDLMSEEWELH